VWSLNGQRLFLKNNDVGFVENTKGPKVSYKVKSIKGKANMLELTVYSTTGDINQLTSKSEIKSNSPNQILCQFSLENSNSEKIDEGTVTLVRRSSLLTGNRRKALELLVKNCNLLSKIYKNISFSSLAECLDLEKELVENLMSCLVLSGAIRAVLDAEEGMLYFEGTHGGNSVTTFGPRVELISSQVNAVVARLGAVNPRRYRID